MRPATFEAGKIIEAGLALQAEGKRITGFGLRNRTGGGNPARLKQVWDEYQAQTAPSTEPVADLPDEVADAVKAISATLAEQLAKRGSAPISSKSPTFHIKIIIYHVVNCFFRTPCHLHRLEDLPPPEDCPDL